MSLRLPALDDAALEALAPKGVVRRARRDLEAGLAKITEHGCDSAKVATDGQTVSIDSRGPAAARCSCPAGGICRHILVAVMALNAEGAAEAGTDTAPEETGPTAVAELCALTQADLAAFARADWRSAVALAAASEEAEVVETGPNCTVTIPGAPAPVTFIAGQGLAGAAFKGPKSRTRVVVAAAAILARARRGAPLDLGSEGETPAGEALSTDYLDDAQRKLAQSVKAVLAGAAVIAADILFDLAISARAEAAPRLTAELRRLARQARLAASRDVHFEADAFLVDAARAYALVQALKHDPNDAALTGAPRRDYRRSPALDLWLLGATTWRTETGARGLTIHGFSPEDRRWRSVSIARAAGADPFFDPRMAYLSPLWSAGRPGALMGAVLHLPEPLVAGDQAIALTLPQPAQVQGKVAGLTALREAGAVISLWAVLRADLASRMGSGLRRRASPTPVLLAPTHCGDLAFNDFTQDYEWAACDRAGDRVTLALSADDHGLARRLAEETSEGVLILAETAGDLDRPTLRPIAVTRDAADGLHVVNLRLDPWPHVGGSARKDKPRRREPPAPPAPQRDPLRDLAQRVVDAAVEACSTASLRDTAPLIRECEAAGLLTLARAVERLAAARDIPSALAAAYLASEITAGLSWR